MPKYRVCVIRETHVTVEIEAPTRDEAETIALSLDDDQWSPAEERVEFSYEIASEPPTKEQP